MLEEAKEASMTLPTASEATLRRLKEVLDSAGELLRFGSSGSKIFVECYSRSCPLAGTLRSSRNLQRSMLYLSICSYCCVQPMQNPAAPMPAREKEEDAGWSFPDLSDACQGGGRCWVELFRTSVRLTSLTVGQDGDELLKALLAAQPRDGEVVAHTDSDLVVVRLFSRMYSSSGLEYQNSSGDTNTSMTAW
ncbi:uncharacterized protein LOC133918643 isoform X1 [Phragmites australis]|uniref:uncharacterized protein LOC133918643 isoform X1 n=1 Tax=Phragmites australis TaxID=29695 RepID=UPI002D7737B8|nr:uncharacterized protein LOC133918643 isoform X1 [Phragmites australis]XP_062218592.1 uncharacterized protein LOC133918643 isoform X1 [Phragmites australis]